MSLIGGCGGAVSACCRHATRILENIQEEGVSISIGSGWKPVLMGSRRRAPSQGAGASWCRVVWALCHPTLGQQAAWLLPDACPPRKGWILSRTGRYPSHRTCIRLHTQPEGGWPPCADLSSSTFSFPNLLLPCLVQALTSRPVSYVHCSLYQNFTALLPCSKHANPQPGMPRPENPCPILVRSLSLPEKPASSGPPRTPSILRSAPPSPLQAQNTLSLLPREVLKAHLKPQSM